MSKKRKKFSKEPVITKIDSISHDGRGIAHIDGKTVFIHNALPDETIKFQYTRSHRRFDEGQSIEILTPSPERISPKCPHYSVCGGCQLQHANTEFQLQHKQAVLIEQLHHFGHVEPKKIVPPITADIWGYRRKARLGARFVDKLDTLYVGFREKNGRYIAKMSECPILHKTLCNQIENLKTLIGSLSICKDIPQIEVAVGDDQTALVFRHIKPLTPDDLEKLRAFGKQHSFWIYLQPDDLNSVHKLYPDDNHLLLTYMNQHLKLQFHPCHFTQVNASINPLMIARAIEWLQPNKDDNILDLFCGLGNFTLPIAAHCKQIIGIEGNDDLIHIARQNAQNNQLSNIKFFTADLNETVTETDWAKQKYNKVILDPPRTGALEILEYIHSLNPECIVYVSCNPATLARDAGKLAELGWTLEKIGILNMFPHTAHFESIALFIPNSAVN